MMLEPDRASDGFDEESKEFEVDAADTSMEFTNMTLLKSKIDNL